MKENLIRLAVFEILGFRQKKLSTLYNRISQSNDKFPKAKLYPIANIYNLSIAITITKYVSFCLQSVSINLKKGLIMYIFYLYCCVGIVYNFNNYHG